MPDLNYEITIQAASDAVMTVDNSSGAALEDYDCRKMYGLPHMFVASGYMMARNGSRVGQSAGTDANGNQVYYGNQFVINDSKSMTSGVMGPSAENQTLRWDIINASSLEQWSKADHPHQLALAAYGITPGYGLGDSSVTGLRGYSGSASAAYPIDRRPTTTAFQLRCESVQHSIQDMSTITALPGIDYGTTGMTGTPEQLDNIALAFGMRKETITLQGIMIDRGLISASNPRRQVILNIARSQYLKIRNLSPIPDASEKKDDDKPDPPVAREHTTQWGGAFAGPMNPRSYPCLTILGQRYDEVDAGSAAGGDGVGTKGDVEADGGYRIYRGVIKSLNWTMEEGRPDFWRWKLTFEVIQNEKRAMNVLQDATNAVVGKDGEDVGE